MIYKGLKIEDVIEDNVGVWSQVCESCAKKIDHANCNELIPLDKYLCGVENCQNIAKYYLEIESKKYINERSF
ncbi:MAG: hypothetical protein AUJ98_00210 [Bacteroidetes bacterium CG2_30_33_31]|nr:MAG: hypothetical protein AUJ98_00210 [Bacteroidetes bacterium CG2_30_33_31]